jgi:hypothetical protein
MVIYEVSLILETQIKEDFGAWLEEHMKEMLTFDGFESAALLHDVNKEPASATVEWTVQYRVRDEASLEQYFQENAGRMREDGLSRFGKAFSASRKIFNVAKEFRLLTYSS